MTSAEARFTAGTPWTVRAFEEVPIAPGWVGVALAGVLIGAFLSSLAALGRLPDLLRAGDYRDIRIGIVMCLWVSYLPTAYVYVLSGARRTLATLTPLLDCTVCEARRRPARTVAKPLVLQRLQGILHLHLVNLQLRLDTMVCTRFEQAG